MGNALHKANLGVWWLLCTGFLLGIAYLFALGFWAATGKLHILARHDRMLVGLGVGAALVGVAVYVWKEALADAEREREQYAAEVTNKVCQALNAGYSLGAEATYEAVRRSGTGELIHDGLRTSPLDLGSLDHDQRELLRGGFRGLIQHLPPHERARAEAATRAEAGRVPRGNS